MSPAVHKFLTEVDVPFTVHSHVPIVTFADAKALLRFDAAAMVKGLAFRLPDGLYAIIGVPAATSVAYRKIADALGVRRADLAVARPDDFVRDLEMLPGGVVPLPINGALVLLDRKLLDLGTIYCGTGRTDSTLEILSSDLIRISGGKMADLTTTH
jgi:Cys-tRNA(Pro)/Cys-tRNA(Cys) deacylase